MLRFYLFKVIFKITSNDDFHSKNMEELTTDFAMKYNPNNINVSSKDYRYVYIYIYIYIYIN